MLEEWDMYLTLCTDDPWLVLQKSRILKHQAAYFLDIDLGKDMDGFALARELRKADPRCFLIFITSHSEMSSLTFRYKLEALDFILKDEPDQIDYVDYTNCLVLLKDGYGTHIPENMIPALFLNLKINGKMSGIE